MEEWSKESVNMSDYTLDSETARAAFDGERR